MRDFWVIEGRAHGKDRNVGTDTSRESREMLSVEARLAHMDQLGIETQVLYPTLFLRPVVQQAERERALCKSYNRWMSGSLATGQRPVALGGETAVAVPRASAGRSKRRTRVG